MNKKLKLNYKNTFFIGLAFFAILMLWQVYNTYCPLILRDLLEAEFEGNADRLTEIMRMGYNIITSKLIEENKQCK